MTDVSKYLLLDRVAVGGMAEVYRAKSLGVEGFEKIIAIKRILPQLSDDHDFISMFIEEAKIAGQLSHANIAPIYELGKIDDTHFIAMEYVFGKDLLQIIERLRRMKRTMPPPMAAWIASRMLEGLDYAHRKRGVDGRPLAIIHRDVSPQNVLVSYDGLVKLIDFGIAKAASRATQTQAGVVKGKLGYMSPEQVMGRTLDHRSDVFAASTCLHEMLTCQRLFVGASDIEVVDKVRAARAPRPSELGVEVPPRLEDVLMRGLARDPNDRYGSAGEMVEALMGFIATQRPPFGTARLGEWMRTAFAGEIAEEKAHLDRLTRVAQPGEDVRGDLHGGFDDEDDEPTVMSQSPIDLMERHAPPPVEVSVMVVVDQVVGTMRSPFEPDEAPPPEPPASSLPPPAPAPYAPAPSPAPYAPAPSPASYAPAPYVPPTLSAPPESHWETPVPGVAAPTTISNRPPPMVSTPHVSPAALSAPSAAMASAAAPEKKRGRGCLLAMLVLVVLIVSLAVGFYAAGGQQILRERWPSIQTQIDAALHR